MCNTFSVVGNADSLHFYIDLSCHETKSIGDSDTTFQAFPPALLLA